MKSFLSLNTQGFFNKFYYQIYFDKTKANYKLIKKERKKQLNQFRDWFSMIFVKTGFLNPKAAIFKYSNL
ncbi:hypothetical protein BpHYR1_027988 [Brachionus plicatilis]|uniref:Uncharacterized protein n=1 Tax=Brachionus plicatilis TaxID=10195 RepID=A0A3M7SA16_BRAPC|nr:hypothetical protein BpHYR1_027988 [Brachionus plicatilis]